MTLGKLPEPRGIGPVGRAIKTDHRDARGVRADRDPRAHDPAHIGKPHRAIVRPQIRSKTSLQGELDEQAAVDVDGAFRLPGGARRVTDQDGMLAVDPDRLAGRTVVVGEQRGVVVVGMI